MKHKFYSFWFVILYMMIILTTILSVNYTQKTFENIENTGFENNQLNLIVQEVDPETNRPLSTDEIENTLVEGQEKAFLKRECPVLVESILTGLAVNIIVKLAKRHD